MSEELPPITFKSITLMFSAAVLQYLGITPNPLTNKTEKNLPMAKQTIDTLEILKQKTKGNLDNEEEKLLESLLYELRMHYVKATESTEPEKPKETKD